MGRPPVSDEIEIPEEPKFVVRLFDSGNYVLTEERTVKKSAADGLYRRKVAHLNQGGYAEDVWGVELVRIEDGVVLQAETR